MIKHEVTNNKHAHETMKQTAITVRNHAYRWSLASIVTNISIERLSKASFIKLLIFQLLKFINHQEIVDSYRRTAVARYVKHNFAHATHFKVIFNRYDCS